MVCLCDSSLAVATKKLKEIGKKWRHTQEIKPIFKSHACAGVGEQREDNKVVQRPDTRAEKVGRVLIEIRNT